MKFGVVVFPGSNCDEDMVYVLRNIMQQETLKLWHKDTRLQGCEAIVLPGGFSYGDYLRSGAIARFSPIMESVMEHAKNGGFVMGICNGFQVLCEAGLLPGALLRNETQLFSCKNVFLKTENHNTLLTKYIPKGKILKIPIAHGEGRYHADEKVLKDLRKNEQIIFSYCNDQGVVSSDSNPNGSLEHIAGICNKNRNVFGMMPHPERAADPELLSTDGKFIFESAIQSFSTAIK